MSRWDADAQKRAVTPNSKVMSVDETTHEVTHLLAGELQTFVQAKNFGTIQFDAPAPTPGETGEYTFSSGGVCTWLDVYPDTNTVVAGDKVQVIYDAATLSYSYELVPLPTNKASAMENDSNVSGASVKDALNTLKAADASLQDNIDAEALARTGADDTLQDNIDAESLARSQADNTLQDNIDAEESSRIDADHTLQDNIDAEESSRIDADHTLQDNIDAETLARAGADNTLQDNIDAETLARAGADNTLQDNIDAEESHRIDADHTLQDNIDAETLARAGADNTLQDNIDAETLARAGADNTLQDNIDAETENREEADIVLQGNINTETAIRETADKALRTESFTPWAPSDGAPTPDIAIGTGKMYAFSEPGICSFITAGAVTVEIGDWFRADRTGVSSWVYTYIDIAKRKLDDSQVYNGTDKTVAGFVLDARTAKTLADADAQIIADETAAAPQIAFRKRWLADSGTQFDVDLAMQAFEKMKAADASTVFTFMPHMASKVRTSELNSYLSKMYSAKDATYDAAQATEAVQPFVGGYIAPNSKRGMKFVQGQTQTGLMDFTDKVYAAGDSWTLTKMVKINNKGTSRVYLGSSYLLSDSTGVTLHNGTTAILVGTYVFECGKTYTIEFQYSNGAGLILVNGLPIHTTTTSGAVTFGQISYNSTYPFDGTLYYAHLMNARKSAAQSQLDHQLLSTFFPDIEGIGIGNQYWATSNFEGTVAGDGTVIPEVQGATTDGNAELITNHTFDTSDGWGITGSSTISGGVARIYSAAGELSQISTATDILIPGKWYRLTYDVVSNVSGSVTVTNSGAPLSTTVGTGKVHYFLADATRFFIKRLSICDITFDNIYIKEVGASDSTLVYNYVYAATTGTAAVKDIAATKASAMWCHYDNLATNGAIYGKLYNWYAVHLFDLYPPMRGWMVPSKADFDQLVANQGGSTVAGGKLKAKFGGFDNANATNESGFSAIPGGKRVSTDGSFTGITTMSYLGTTNLTSSTSWGFAIRSSTNDILVGGSFTGSGVIGFMSLRFLRNEPNGADTAIWTTGSFTTDIASTAKVLTIPCGYRVREIRVLSANNLTNIAVNVYDYANTTLIGNILTGKSVTANIESIFTATQIDAPTPYQDRNLRITAAGNASPGMTVMAFLEKILKPIAN